LHSLGESKPEQKWTDFNAQGRMSDSMIIVKKGRCPLRCLDFSQLEKKGGDDISDDVGMLSRLHDKPRLVERGGGGLETMNVK